MKKIKICGQKRLSGEVTMSGAKNSTVALIPAAILADSPVTLEGVPDIADVYSLINIVEEMGVKTKYDVEEHRLWIDPTNIVSVPMPTGKINSLRASYYFMGALLGKFGEAVVGLPGGCNLGPRPIDLHIKGFEALGVDVENHHGVEYLTTGEEGLVGTRIFMDIVSIGATINVMLAAVKAKGRTVIENAAKEPEIVDVAMLLNNMGAKIYGAGTDELRIDGVEHLHGVTHTVVPDRIEAGTYITMAAINGDDAGVRINNIIPQHLEAFLSKLKEMGVHYDLGEDYIHVWPVKQALKPTNIKTSPYPGFATDLQQPTTPLLFLTSGESIVIDNIYQKRVNHVSELARMGAKAKVEGNMIVIQASPKLVGTEVRASDLRAGACLVCAGLMAGGETKISNIYHILRGYDHIIEKLTVLGADISMIEEEDEEE